MVCYVSKISLSSSCLKSGIFNYRGVLSLMLPNGSTGEGRCCSYLFQNASFEMCDSCRLTDSYKVKNENRVDNWSKQKGKKMVKLGIFIWLISSSSVPPYFFRCLGLKLFAVAIFRHG